MTNEQQLAKAVLDVLKVQVEWTTASTSEELTKMMGDIHVICARVFFLATSAVGLTE